MSSDLFEQVRRMSPADVHLHDNEHAIPIEVAVVYRQFENVGFEAKGAEQSQYGDYRWYVSDELYERAECQRKGFGIFVPDINQPSPFREVVDQDQEQHTEHMARIFFAYQLTEVHGLGEAQAAEFIEFVLTPGKILVLDNLDPVILFHERLHREIHKLPYETAKVLADVGNEIKPHFFQNAHIGTTMDEVMTATYIRDSNADELYCYMAHAAVFSLHPDHPLYIKPEIQAYVQEQHPLAFEIYSGIRDRVAEGMLE